MITSNSLFKASHVLEPLCCSPNKVQLTLYRFLLSRYLSSPPSLFSSPLLFPPLPFFLQVGQILRKATAGTGKKISLELGGKSPFVVYDTADLDAAVEGVVDAIFFNQGQVCSRGSYGMFQ